MSDEKQYMLLFSLGPVQSFIAQARKTRDLMLGSFLLSMLMEAAMKGLDKEKLVFPADPIIKNGISDLPNKFIAFSTIIKTHVMRLLVVRNESKFSGILSAKRYGKGSSSQPPSPQQRKRKPRKYGNSNLTQHAFSRYSGLLPRVLQHSTLNG